ncbi:MAG: riboflavin synthase [Candidatus Cloacimonetes bacterium]|nr:riboflavin synthase [Candidatus Cloacimonadota bacterium]
MFTGIIEEIGTVIAIRESGGKRFVTLSCKQVLADLKEGDSICCDGACLTAISFDASSVTVEVMHETLSKTTIGAWSRGRKLNLERAMRAAGRFDGHIVQGHVDTASRLLEARRSGETLYLAVQLPRQQAALVVAQGSVAVNGVSLTVSALGTDRFEVVLIGHTLAHTNLSSLRSGELVNIEYDILGKYVLRQVESRKGGMSEEWLREQGY